MAVGLGEAGCGGRRAAVWVSCEDLLDRGTAGGRRVERRGVDRWPANKAMKLTRLSAAPGWFREYPAEGAASCPRWRETAGTASQLIRSVLRTREGAHA